MRVMMAALIVVVGSVGAVAAADLWADSFVSLSHGSAFGTRTTLTTTDRETDCVGQCQHFLAFAPATELSVLYTVRNEGPVTVSLDGASAGWASDNFAYQSFEVLSVGELAGPFDDRRAVPFSAVTLDPGDEWTFLLRLQTGDLADMCANMNEGNAIGFGDVDMTWRWLAAQHESEIQLPEITFLMAPTVAECGEVSSG